MKPTCEGCAFFYHEDQRECHKKAPTVFILPDPRGRIQTFSCFPPTQANNWCGEYEPAVQVAEH